jgi:Domain of unknown function (DUF4160)
MPTISMFYGILIRMFLGMKEHNPPHFHAYYQGMKGVFDIGNCEMIEGDLPTKQVKLITAWAELHKDELLADWELSRHGEKPYSIDPLR